MKTLVLVVLFLASAPYSCSGVTSLRLHMNSSELTDCSRGDVGLTDTSIQVQFRFTQGATVSEWSTLTEIDPKIGVNRTFELPPLEDFVSEGVQLRLLQLEHGGWTCNCWKIEAAVVMSDSTRTDILDMGNFCSTLQAFGLTFCYGLASAARGFISRAGRITPGGSTLMECPGNSDTLIPRLGSSLTVDNCPTATNAPRLSVIYGLVVESGVGNCDGPTNFDEAIEFGMRTKTFGVYGPWIPLRLTQHTGTHTTPVNVRGYDVEVNLASQEAVMEQVTICGDNILPANASEVQFRWMNTAGSDFDFWTIFNVTVNFTGSNGGDMYKIFDSNIQNSSWPEIRNGGTRCNDCPDVDLPCDLAFSGFPRGTMISFALISSIALSQPLFLRNGDSAVCPTCASTDIMPAPTSPSYLLSSSNAILSQVSSFELTRGSVKNSLATSQYYPFVVPTSSLMMPHPTSTTESTKHELSSSSQFTFALLPTPTSTKAPTLVEAVMSAEPLDGSQLLLDNLEELEPPATLYLLRNILDRFNSTNLEEQSILVQNSVKIGEDIIARGDTFSKDANTVGSSLVSIIDRLALEVLPTTGNFSSENITIQAAVIFAGFEGYVTTINSTDYFGDAIKMSIQIPAELVKQFSHSNDDEKAVRVISALYYNVKQLFPSGLNGSPLGSGIVSTGLQCGDYLCDTTGGMLRKPVVIVIESNEVMSNAECVFWKFSSTSFEDRVVSMGEWSDDKCSKNNALSNDSYTVCECYHLTHFAILLSPVPLSDFSPSVKLSLQAIDFVGVPISVVAMATTVATFIFFKSLHNMRNYIHIHLCINLMIAQLIFVVGIDKSAEDHVPVHCQAIAVLLHYYFLVSFMWMLMEGVVLYFILIRVFVTKTKKYIFGFTLASYGIPLLYLSLTIPLGFSLPAKHYGYSTACFLNAKTHFIWAFIAPVLLIIFFNIGFLIMAAVALLRQKSQKGEMDRKSIASWLKAVGFLVVVMGITWIIGVLVMEVEALLPLAYIFTIMVAFQGVAIFLSLVAFQKSVRDEYIKWFRRQKFSKFLLETSAGLSTSSALPKKIEGIYTAKNNATVDENSVGFQNSAFSTNL